MDGSQNSLRILVLNLVHPSDAQKRVRKEKTKEKTKEKRKKKKGCPRRIRVRQDTENINTKLKSNFSFSPQSSQSNFVNTTTQV